MTSRSGRRVAATTGGAIGLSALASFVGLCCIGPWAVALFGVPGAVYLARWEPARPFLLLAAALMLAWAFWRVYFRPPGKCDDGTCKAKPSPWLRALLWLALLILLTALLAGELQWLLIDPTPEGLRS